MIWFKSSLVPNVAIAPSRLDITTGMSRNQGDASARRWRTVLIVTRLLPVNGSGLRKHACLATDLLPFNTRLSADCTRSVDVALLQLQKSSKYHLKQLGFADSDPLNVAVAEIRYLHLNPAVTQSQNITPCQHSASKFDIVQRCCGVLVWVPWPKDDILPVLLDETADIVEGLAEAVPSKLPKRQAEHLNGYVNHVLRPCWKSNHPEYYEELYRRQRPNLVENRDAVCAAVTALEFK